MGKRSKIAGVHLLLSSLMLLNGAALAAPGESPEPSISEVGRPDTVRLQAAMSQNSPERVEIPNSREAKGLGTAASAKPPENGDIVEESVWPAQQQKHTAPLRIHGRVRSKGKIISGAVLFGVSYGAALAVSSLANSMESGMSSGGEPISSLRIPVVGPLILYFTESSPGSESTPALAICAVWSVAQGLGLGLLISGIVGSPARQEILACPVTVEPLVMKDGGGLTVRLRL